MTTEVMLAARIEAMLERFAGAQVTLFLSGRLTGNVWGTLQRTNHPGLPGWEVVNGGFLALYLKEEQVVTAGEFTNGARYIEVNL